MADLLFPARWRVTDANDNPVSGALALFYDTGTTNLRTVYSDAAGTVPHASPLVADANGVFPTVFATGGTGVKVVVTTSAGVALYTADPVVKTPTTATAATISFTPTAGIPETDVQAAIENVRDQLPSAGVSAFARTLLDDADAAAARTTLDAMRRASVDVTDLDDATENAPFRFVSGASNAPFAATGMGITVAAETVANLMQIAVRASNGDMWVRSRSGSSWTAWGKVTRDADVPGLFNASGSAPVYACRAWVLFNGTGTPAVIAAGNVSSITDNGTGDYTVNFTTAMPDANYAMSGSGRRDDTFNEVLAVGEARTALATRTTSALRVIVSDAAGGLRDGDRVSVIIHR